jgi:Fic family protein
MDVEALRKSPVGHLVPVSGTDNRTGEDWQYWAFVPDPLPEEPVVGLKAVNTATLAAMEVARLDQAVSQLPNPDILVRPVIRREAISTAALEGTYTTFDDAFEADFLEERQLSSEQREVRNYVYATEQSVRLLETFPISRTLAGKLQKTIVRGTSGDTYDAGDLRKRLVAIGPKNRPIQEARFVPPPPDETLSAGVSDWEKWLNADSAVPIIVKIALGHYQFETLHPYADGNGRLGRLLALLQLVQAGVLRVPVLNLAPWLEAHRGDYQDGLLNVTKTGRFDDWITFFAEAIRAEASRGVRSISELLALRDQFVSELRAAGSRGVVLEIAELLIGYPLIDVPTARDITGKSFEAANHAIARLVQMRVLQEITGRPQNRLFACPRVLEIITS